MNPTRQRNVTWRSLWLSTLILAALLSLACDVQTVTEPKTVVLPQIQMHLSMVSGNDQVGTVGQPLAAPFVVRAVDQHGGPVSGAVVLWDILEGGGDLPAAPKEPRKLFRETKTDESGVGSLVLTLGTEPGDNVVEVRLMFGAGSATFVATAMAAR